MSDARFEIKLVGSQHDYARVLADLRLLQASLRPLYAKRKVQSIYFDTADGRAVDENLAGISDRRKVRLRWYGAGRLGVTTQLECKLRRNGFGGKRVHVIEEPLDVAGALRHRFAAEVRRLLPPAMAQELDGLEPAQWIGYEREYHATPDRSLRITIDRDLWAADQRDRMRLDDRRRTPLPRLLIVEVKAAVTARDELERFVRELPMRPSKCSKFVIASVPAEAPVPSSYL